MNLSNLFNKIQCSLIASNWQFVIEDDSPGLKQLVCRKPVGLLNVFTRLDILIMTPEFNPVDASGICLCFLYYADPVQVVDMRKLGKSIRLNEFQFLRLQCELIFNAADIILGKPSIKIVTRPKHEKIRFNDGNVSHPAFMVELDYWLSCEEYSSAKILSSGNASYCQSHYEHRIDSRIEAIYSLRGSELQETEKMLLNAVADSNPQIRKAGLAVLTEYCDEKYLPLIHEALHDDDEEIRILAGAQLKLFRKYINGDLRVNAKPSVRDCLKALEDKNDIVRQKAVEALVGVTDREIIQPLLKVMKSGNETRWCRLSAMDALDLFDCPELLDEFYSILGVGDVGEHAAYKLANKTSPVAHDMLLKALCSENGVAKISAAKAIWSSADVRALPPLCNMLEDNDLEYRTIAIHSLFSLWFRLQEADDHQTDTCVTVKTKSHVVASLIKATSDENRGIRGKSLELLSEIDKPQAAPVVTTALEEFIQYALSDDYKEKNDYWDFDWFQSCLHTAVITLGDKIFCEPLRRLLNAKSWYVKIDAVETLLKLGDESGICILIEALDNADWIIRVIAAENLLRLGNRSAWDVLVNTLVDDFEDAWFIKEGIIDSLANSGDTRTIDLFIDILNNVSAYSICDEVIGKIITWLGNTGDSSAIGPIKKWRHEELINCDDDLAEKALKSLEAVNACLMDHQI